MRIAFLTNSSLSSLREYSGTSAFMASALSRVGIQVEPVIAPIPSSLFVKLKNALLWRLTRKPSLMEVEPILLRMAAREIGHHIHQSRPDWVFSYSSILVAYLKTSTPIAFWSDAVFDGMVGFYPDYSNLRSECLKNGHHQEQKALSNCRLALYSSEWAADGAKRLFRVDASKVHVVSYGANLERVPDQRQIVEHVEARSGKVLKLLFIGADWARKGGDLALQVAQKLDRMGHPVELHIVGGKPAGDLPGFVRNHGFLRKDEPADVEKLRHLFSSSHFLLLPSRAECCAMVLAEACAFGVPCLASDVGGNRTSVQDGVNGYLFSPESFADEATRLILRVMATPKSYRDLAFQAYRRYCEQLNWSVAASKVKALLEHSR